MSHLLARKRSTASLRRKISDDASTTTPGPLTPSDQRSREAKGAPYRDTRYVTLLQTKGVFMEQDKEAVTDASKGMCQTLLDSAQKLPDETLFSDDYFEETCKALKNRNETRVIRDISVLIVPSAEISAIRGDEACRVLIESTNDGWNNSIPITQTRPQPDYSVGFRREAFTESQLDRIQPFVGGLYDTSYLMGTFFMYFPFLSCEVKCGAGGLDVADRQNAHSMAMALRGVVELFRLVKREKELHREILAFSISHDHQTVRIFGHYPVIQGSKTTYYRHPINAFDFQALDGKEKWTAYKFTKNVYDVWMPAHFQRLCSVIDAIPLNVNFELSEIAELQFASSSGLAQGLQSHHTSQPAATDDEPEFLDASRVTPDTSVTHASKQPTTKRPKRA